MFADARAPSDRFWIPSGRIWSAGSQNGPVQRPDSTLVFDVELHGHLQNPMAMHQPMREKFWTGYSVMVTGTCSRNGPRRGLRRIDAARWRTGRGADIYELAWHHGQAQFARAVAFTTAPQAVAHGEWYHRVGTREKTAAL